MKRFFAETVIYILVIGVFPIGYYIFIATGGAIWGLFIFQIIVWLWIHMCFSLYKELNQ